MFPCLRIFASEFYQLQIILRERRLVNLGAFSRFDDTYTFPSMLRHLSPKSQQTRNTNYEALSETDGKRGWGHEERFWPIPPPPSPPAPKLISHMCSRCLLFNHVSLPLWERCARRCFRHESGTTSRQTLKLPLHAMAGALVAILANLRGIQDGGFVIALLRSLKLGSMRQ